MSWPIEYERMSRRAWLRGGSLFLLGGAIGASPTRRAAAFETLLGEDPSLRIGLVTDLHHADKPAHGSRHYRETTTKLVEAGKQFRRDKVKLLVELGDFIDAAESVDTEQRYLAEIQQKFQQLPGEKHYVLGNHCVDTLTKQEFLKGVGREQSYYAFDAGAFHFVVLDSCFREDGTPYGRKNFKWTDANIPEAELKWLAADLKQAGERPTIVFAHQRLDVSDNKAMRHYGVRNATAVREVLQQAENVQAVFQGHSHKNDHREIDGIHYTTLVAMVEGSGAENSGYSTLDVLPGGGLRLSGFRKQQGYRW